MRISCLRPAAYTLSFLLLCITAESKGTPTNNKGTEEDKTGQLVFIRLRQLASKRRAYVRHSLLNLSLYSFDKHGRGGKR